MPAGVGERCIMMRWLAGVLAAAMLGGCASTHEGAVNPALFPRGTVAPEVRLVGPVALWVPAEVRATVVVGESLIAAPIPNRHVQVPVGRIVEQAALAALTEAFPGGVRSVQTAPARGEGLQATLVIDAVRFEYRDRLKYLVPVPVPGSPLIVGDTVDVWLAFDLRLLDSQGRTASTRSYDAGRETWTPKPRATELAEDGIVRLAHEAAWHLAQQAVLDLRRWLELQRENK
jgi:hypothetical protein